MDEPPEPAAWRKLLKRINSHYHAVDEHRYTLERSLQISSDEMRELYAGLDRERSQLESIVLALPQAVFVLDAARRIQLDNPASRNLLGAAAPPGTPVDEHLRFEVRGAPTSLLDLPSQAPDGVVTVCTANGEHVPVEVQCAPLDDGILITLSDLRPRLAQQAALHEARLHVEVAQRAEQARGSFLARMSHELRTPLNAIIGYSELLLDDVRSPDGRADLNRIHGAGTHLLALINDILDLSKIDAGKMELHERDVRLGDVLIGVRDTLRPLALEQGTALEVEVEDAVVRIDEAKLKQCLFNLAGNAIRYTDKGRVVLRARILGDRMRIDVEDDGVGIPPEALPRLFEPFRQAPGARGGTGLGLSLVRALAERMGGHCTVRSELGRGSCFTLDLPTTGEPSPRQTS